MASLYDVSVRRPVFATVMSLAILIGGAIGYMELGVREYPIVQTPVISVRTDLRGANAAVVESQITEPIEESVNAIDGIRSITSTSSQGRSSVRVEFDLGADLDAAAADVRDRVSRARGQIPDEAEEPIISKSNTDGEPVIFLNLSSEEYDLLELSEIADNFFAERLQTIDGVASVDIWGDKRYAMRMWMDPVALAAYGLTPGDVRRAVTEQNVELPGGLIEGDQVELTIRPLTRLSTVEEFEDIILKNDGTSLVRFSDVGRVELAAQNQRTILKRDGVAMVGVVLRPLADANSIQIVDEFYDRLDDIEKDIPDGIELGIGFDNTEPIRDSITEVRNTVFIALALVVLVIFGFLRDWRTTLIPALVIPVSLVGAFGVMALAGFSINVLTLLALVLAIGLVVDDAIVVLENIYAKIEEGMSPVAAAVAGTKEIYVAVIATTLALVAVFLPIIFQSGVVGALFREFGLTIAAAVVISSFAALTLTPMLASKLLVKRDQKPWVYRKTEPFFQRLNGAYRSSLEAFLRVRWMAFVIMLASAGGVYWLFTTLESELAPAEDRSQMRVFANAPQGRGFGYMDAYTDELITLLQREVPELEALITVTSPGFGSGAVNSAFGNLILVAPDDREASQDEIADRVQKAVGTLPGARVGVSQPATISTSSSRGSPVQLVIQAPNLNALQDALPAFMERATQDPSFQYVRVDLEFTLPELQVEVDRDRAQALGIPPVTVAEALAVALSEGRFGYFNRDGEQYEIIGQLEREARDTPNAIQGIFVRSADGQPIPLSNLVRLTESAAPPQLYRFNRFTAATVSAEPAEGVALGDAIDTIETIADETLPSGFSTALDGQSRDFRETGGSILIVFGLALVLIYLVLSAQFESFRDPVTILLTVPLALLGALGALLVFGTTLNVFSQIGLVMLIGLVTKNGILIVEFAKQKREEGLNRRDAAAEASAARFRPILMTAFSTVLGTLPIALGSGSESRAPMGLAVIGGLVVGTALTLYVIPALYTYIASESATRIDDEVDELEDQSASTDGDETEDRSTAPLDASGDGASGDLPDAPPLRASEAEAGGDGASAETATPSDDPQTTS